jgi:hypothetical protein
MGSTALRLWKGIFAFGFYSYFSNESLLSCFLRWQNTLFDVGRWMFDVRRSSVSHLIKLTAFQTSGGADTGHLLRIAASCYSGKYT